MYDAWGNDELAHHPDALVLMPLLNLDEGYGPSAPGKDPWGNTRIGLSATAKINRKDYGLAWNAALETGGFLVGEDIAITLDVEFIKAAQ